MVSFAVLVWAIANLLHPIVLQICWNTRDSLGDVIGFAIFSIFFSLPSLIISILVLMGIKRIRIRIAFRYILWMLSIPVIVFLNIQSILLMSGGPPSMDPIFLDFGVPPVIAAFIASLICGQQFFKRINEIERLPKKEREAL
jgi:hypothetical protein